MAIEKIIKYSCVCDGGGCKKVFELDSKTVFDTKEEIKSSVKGSEWFYDKDEFYCFQCAEKIVCTGNKIEKGSKDEK